jgi:hypothetical protein
MKIIKKIFFISFIVVIFVNLFRCEFLDYLTTTQNNNLTEAEVVDGLKTALAVGIDTAAFNLGKIGGYLLNETVKILLPEDVQNIISFTEKFKSQLEIAKTTLDLLNIKIIDMSSIINARDSLLISINRAAETAVPLSVPIFKKAINDLTIYSAFSILYGDSTAATSYLHDKTYFSLIKVYSPFVDSALNKVGAQNLWNQFALNYNNLVKFYKSIPSSITSNFAPLPYDSVTTNLGEYTVSHALNGIFYMIGQEEKKIRIDPLARINEILRKVFGVLDNNQK